MYKNHLRFDRVKSFLSSLFVLLLFTLSSAIAQGPPDIVWMRGGHTGDLGGVSISADGTLLVSSQAGGFVSSIHEVKVHRLLDGTLLKTFATYNGANSYRSILSPVENKLSTFGQDLDGFYLKLWSIPSGTLLWKQQITGANSANGDFHTLGFSSNGAQVYIQAVDIFGQIDLWGFKVADGTPLGSIPCFYGFAASSNRVAIFGKNNGSDNTTLCDTLLNPIASWGFASDVNAFSPDGTKIVSLSRGNYHYFLSLQSSLDGSNLQELAYIGPTGNSQTPVVNGLVWQNSSTIYGMANQYQPDPMYPGTNGEVFAWDSTTGTRQTLWTVPFGVPQGFSVWPAGAPAASLLATAGYHYNNYLSGSQDAFISVVNTSNGTATQFSDQQGKSHTAFDFHENHVVATDWSADGSRIASGSSDGTAKIWQALDGGLLCSLQLSSYKGDYTPVRQVALSPDGTQLAVSTGLIGLGESASAGYLNVWDIHNTDTPVLAYKLSGICWHAAYSPDGKILATIEGVPNSFTLFLRRPSDGSVIRSIHVPATSFTNAIAHLAFAPDGKTLACFVSDIGYLAIVRVSDLAILKSTSIHQYGQPTSLSYTSDGKSLAVGFRLPANCGLAMFNTSNLSLRWQHGQSGDPSGISGHVFSVTCDPCSGDAATESFFTSGSTTTNNLMFLKTSDGSVAQRYDQEVMSGGYFGEGAVNSITYSPDAQYYVYARWDNGLVVARNPNWSPPVLSTLSVSPDPVPGSIVCTGTASLDCLAPIGDSTVTLNSSNPTLASVPANVVIPVGKKSTSFAITTQPVSVISNVTLTAQYTFPGQPSVTKTKVITLLPPALSSLALSKNTIYGGDPVVLTASLTSASTLDSVITLLSSNSAVNVPASIVVPAGSVSASISVSSNPVLSSTAGTIKAVLNGVTKTISLTVKPMPISSLTLSPATIKGGSGSSTATVTLAGIVSADTILILSSASGYVTIPTNIVVLAGSKTVTCTVGTNVTTVKTTAVIIATAGGVSKSAALTITP